MSKLIDLIFYFYFKLIDLIFYLAKIISKNPAISFFSFFGLLIIYSIVFEEKTLITVDKNDFKKESVNRFNSDFNKTWSYGKTFVINNSGKNLVFESVVYKSSGNFNDVDNDVKIISPLKNKIQVLQNNCDYIFRSPPSSIRTKNYTEKKYWLHWE